MTAASRYFQTYTRYEHTIIVSIGNVHETTDSMIAFYVRAYDQS